jgi:pimeloyl-ACP methyl ester carboxylesterase
VHGAGRVKAPATHSVSALTTRLAAWSGSIGRVLSEELEWRGRSVRWGRAGSGPAVVFCHGTPWSSDLWRPVAEALAPYFSVYLWDMPGYGESSKHPEHRVSLDLQGELFSDLLAFWELRSPHVVAHDYGGAVALRAHLLHERGFTSLALVDVVALRPWGSDFFRLVRDHAELFTALPSGVHEGAVRGYISGASHRGLTPSALDALTQPWLDDVGQAAFYRQIAEADEVYTDQVEPLYPTIEVPVLVVWGRDDAWISVDRAHRLHELIPGARLTVIEQAGHLIQLDQPEALTAALARWLMSGE